MNPLFKDYHKNQDCFRRGVVLGFIYMEIWLESLFCCVVYTGKVLTKSGRGLSSVRSLSGVFMYIIFLNKKMLLKVGAFQWGLLSRLFSVYLEKVLRKVRVVSLKGGLLSGIFFVYTGEVLLKVGVVSFQGVVSLSGGSAPTKKTVAQNC